jgi:hypothetical protein
LAEIGFALAAAGRPTEAVRTLTAAIGAYRDTGADLSANEALARLTLGRLLLRAGEGPTARAHLESAQRFWRSVDPQSRFAVEAAQLLQG